MSKRERKRARGTQNAERKKKEGKGKKRGKKRFEVRDTRVLVRVHAQNVRACVSTTASMHDA